MPTHPDDDLQQAGWTTVDLLTTAEVAQVQAVCDELLAVPAEQRSSRDKPVAGTRHLFELDERSDVINEIVGRSALTEIVTELLGSTWRRVETSYRCPQPTYGSQQLHADDVPKLDDGPNRVATAIVALTEFTEHNGATRLIPGSHRRVDLQRQSGSLRGHPDEVMVTAAAGTAVVFSGHLLHSGTQNLSSQDRPALQLVWNRGAD